MKNSEALSYIKTLEIGDRETSITLKFEQANYKSHAQQFSATSRSNLERTTKSVLSMIYCHKKQ